MSKQDKIDYLKAFMVMCLMVITILVVNPVDGTSNLPYEIEYHKQGPIIHFVKVHDKNLNLNPKEDWYQEFEEELLDPGYYLEEGRLKYVDETGHYVSDYHIGCHLYFNDSGYQTSGNEELDNLVSSVIQQLQQEHPATTRFELLRYALDYCAYNIKYFADRCPAIGDNCNDEWYIPTAIKGLDILSGNCYTYSAAFTALARGLGYDAHCITSYALDNCWHGWTEIKILRDQYDEQGDWRIFDPQMEWHEVVAGTRSNYGYHMFNIDKNIWSYWRYKDYSPEQTCYN